MKRPQITQAPWSVIPIEHGVFTERWRDFSHRIQGEIFSPCAVFADGKNNAGTSAANARAIAAIPTLLAALESAYLRAVQDVCRMELIRGSESPEVEPAYNEACAIRDEYKAALIAAGYSFTDEPAS